MTTVSNAEIEAYVAAVGAALTDLGQDVRADLLEDLPEHLVEVLSEDGEATLRERLGDPVDYAAELRAAAGYADPTSEPGPAAGLAAAITQFRQRLDRADRALGALLGYGRAVTLARALQPGWWVLRGWIVALMITLKFNAGYWTGFIPHVFGGWPLGALLVVACVLVSAWVGRLTARGSAQTRLIAAIASITIAVFGIFIARNLVGWEYASYYGPHGYGGVVIDH